MNDQSKKTDDQKYAANPYGVPASKLNPATIPLLSDPNYQNVILPKELDQKLAKKLSFFVYYFKSDCPHCKVTTPVIVPIQKEVGVDVKQLNLLEYNEGWQKYNIQATPTLIYYKNGVEADRLTGGIPETAGGAGNKPELFKQFFQKYKS